MQFVNFLIEVGVDCTVQRYPTCLQIAIQLLLYIEVTSDGDCLLLQKQIGLLIKLISLHA